MIRLVVADDQALVRAGLVAVLESQSDLEVVGQAADGRAAVDAVRAFRPDVVLMDVRMPVLDGIAATAQIAADRTATARVLVLTTFDVDDAVYSALRAGASGFLLKDAPQEQLYAAVRTVAAGEVVLAPSATTRLVERHLRMAAPSEAQRRLLAHLTARERDVLAQVAAGRSNAEIAAAEHISTTTVRTHVAHLLDKLQVRDRVQLVVFAYESGLLTPGARVAHELP